VRSGIPGRRYDSIHQLGSATIGSGMAMARKYSWDMGTIEDVSAGLLGRKIFLFLFRLWSVLDIRISQLLKKTALLTATALIILYYPGSFADEHYF